jgi:hypothetical protein
MRAKAAYATLAITLASAALAFGALGGDRHDRAPARVRAAGAGASALTISGYVRGLYPGARRGMRVEVRNRSARWARLRAVGAEVGSGRSGCSPDHLSTLPRSLGHPRIGPHETRRIRIRVRMWKGAPDACQGARFPLRFRVRVGR